MVNYERNLLASQQTQVGFCHFLLSRIPVVFQANVLITWRPVTFIAITCLLPLLKQVRFKQ